MHLGTGISIFGGNRPNYGTFSLAVDGQLVVTGTARSTVLSTRQLLGTVSGLINGPHTAVFANTNGQPVDLDSIELQSQVGALGWASSRYHRLDLYFWPNVDLQWLQQCLTIVMLLSHIYLHPLCGREKQLPVSLMAPCSKCMAVIVQFPRTQYFHPVLHKHPVLPLPFRSLGRLLCFTDQFHLIMPIFISWLTVIHSFYQVGQVAKYLLSVPA